MTSSHQQLAELKQFVQDNKQHRVAHLRGVHLFPDRIIRLPEGLLGGLLGGGMQNMTADAECHPLAGVTAKPALTARRPGTPSPRPCGRQVSPCRPTPPITSSSLLGVSLPMIRSVV
jgi:hypothetical protein